ncbi:hypothetical protein ACHAWF_011560, partial [Thalassiosira exigua]
FSSLFVTHKPRDAFDGVRSGLSNVLRGAAYGLLSLLACPAAGFRARGGPGALAGLAGGVAGGAAATLAGVVAGGYQVARGLVETPAAIWDGFVRCKVYDEARRTWTDYRLDDDLEEIAKELEEERRREKERGEAGSDGRSSSSSAPGGRTVQSTACYDLLGVPPSATQSEIRSAYRRTARKIHPDKNPDDPDAPRKFRELGAAYRTLSDPARREEYDASGVGVDPEASDSAGRAGATLDPLVFFAVLFGSDRVEPYVGELGVATTFDLLLKLATSKAAATTATTSFETWEDVKSAFGIKEAALRRRKREADIASHLRTRVEGYVEGYLAPGAFAEGCGEEARGIANGDGDYGPMFLLAIGPALVAEADAFLGYRSSVLGSWRGPLNNAKRNFLALRRKLSVAKAVARTAKESLTALYESTTGAVREDLEDGSSGRRRRRPDADGAGTKKPELDKELLKEHLSDAIPTVLEMAWAINYVDISRALRGACLKLFRDADVPSWEERLRRAEAVRVLGAEFWRAGLEATEGGNATLAGARKGGGGRGGGGGAGDADDIKARANAALAESLRRGMEKGEADDGRARQDEM